MRVYGFVIITYQNNTGAPVTQVSVFRDRTSWEQAIEVIQLDDHQEINTFETDME